MKRCPTCQQTYTDETLKFCRDDGATLITDDSLQAESATQILPSSHSGDQSHAQTLHNAKSETTTSVLDVDKATAQTAGLKEPRPTSSAEQHSTKRISPRRIGFALALIALLLTVLVCGYWFSARRSANATQIEAIAVLPFQNESGNAEMEYLSDGMTESLITSLSQLPKLNVKARSSVFRYKGKETSVQTIGKELSVQAVLTGRVIARGEDLALYVELVDAATENVLWKADYKRQMANLATLQSEIARDVADKLKVKLSGADEQRLAKNYTENADAYQLYLRGRFYTNKRTPKDSQKAIEYFNQAIAADPKYALAFASLADAYSILSSFGGAPSHEAMPKAREAVLKALSLDNNLAEAHAALGLILSSYDYDFAGAEREFRRAIELNPNYATAHHYYAQLLNNLSRFEEASAEYRRALEVDPLSLIINRHYGESLFFARRYDAGLAQLKKTVELDANFASVYASLALLYQVKGNYAESVEAQAREQELFGNTANAALIRESFARGGWKEFLRVVTEAPEPILSPWHNAAAFHAELGNK
ncbi:MAG: tetratricopeptide repeat protein, partial [Pyrinomonadaceae bacterium]|nr:tetratricopeptide repeat protein [Pyrinomonadaceae bacterium]